MYKRNRKMLSYRIHMWFYRLTFKDIKHFVIWVCENIFEIAAIIILFAMLFILPAIFR